MCARERTITTCVHPPQQTKCLTPQDHHSDERTEDADPYRDFCQSVKKSKNTTKKSFYHRKSPISRVTRAFCRGYKINSVGIPLKERFEL